MNSGPVSGRLQRMEARESERPRKYEGCEIWNLKEWETQKVEAQGMESQ